MNCVSLDTIGIAGFGHDFGALRGEHGIVEEAFDSLASVPPRGLNVLLLLLGPLFPVLLKVPTKRQMMLKKLHQSMQGIAEGLFKKTKKDAEAGTFSSSSRSIIGALGKFSAGLTRSLANHILVRAERAEGRMTLTEEEVLAQVRKPIIQ